MPILHLYHNEGVERKMKFVKPKKCAVCGCEFVPSVTTQKVCGLNCAISLGKTKVEAKNRKEWQQEKKVRKENLKTHKGWLQDLQRVFNQFIRERDKGQPCISCGTTNQSIKYDAGHFYSVGAYPNVRFDEDNVHRQCSNNCNVHLSGNIIEYRPRLIKKIGTERFEQLEIRAKKSILKISVPEIKDKIEHYKKMIKKMKRDIMVLKEYDGV